MNLTNFFIDFDQFNQYYSLNKNDTIEIVTSPKKSSSKIYLFKKFKIRQNSSQVQKIILDTFLGINDLKNRFIQTYKRLSFSFINNQKMKPTLSMKFISSRTLEIILRSQNLLKNWKIKTILKCIFSISEAMNYLHTNLVIHGNLCPSNIIIDETDQFYVCDFRLYPIKRLCLSEENLFNKIYKDPSMINNEPSFNTDVYSFGILMCQLFLSYYGFEKDNTIFSEEKLQEFISNPNQNKYDQFPKDFAKLIQLCCNPKTVARPSFSQIIETIKDMKTIKDKNEEINILELYNELIGNENLLKVSYKKGTSSLKKIGNMYDKGIYVEENKQKAIEFYKRAADMDDAKAQNQLGILLQDVGMNNKPDLKEGAKYLKKSAEQGNICGMMNYGMILNDGCGVKKDAKKAEEYLKKSADSGWHEAQVNYGYILIRNNPTPERINEGLKYIKMAMDQKYHEAFCTYAYILKEGVYLKKNVEQAMHFYKVAADMGNDDAMIEYASGNENGIGVPKNIEIAMEYYQLAAIKGNEVGKEKIKELLQINNQLPDPSKNQISQPKSSIPHTNCKKSSNTKNNNPLILSEPKDKPNIISNDIKDDQNEIKNKIDIKLPLLISPKIRLISLGEVVYDRPNYHNKRYIYPVGYQIEREYFSIDNPDKQAVYRATILDGGDYPIFQVECLDKSKMVFQRDTPSKPWVDIYLEIKKSRERLGIPINDNPCNRGFSGPILFGLTQRTVAYLIDHLPNANKCKNHIFQKLYIKGIDDKIEGGKEVTFFNEIKNESNQKNTIKTEKINFKNDEDQKPNINSNHNIQSSQDDEVSKIIFNSNKPVDELIQIGNELSNQNEHDSAFRYYKEAANRGHTEAYLKCAEVAPTFESELEYFELAISKQVPGSFNLLREFIITIVQSKGHVEKYQYFAQLFARYGDFSDAAFVYHELKDKLNFRICYELAKENIEKVEDGYQQYVFGILAQNQHDYELAKLLFNKSIENGFQQAKDKIIEIENNYLIGSNININHLND